MLSPQIVDTNHPFPHLEGKMLYVGVLLAKKKSEVLGLLPVPASLPPLVFLPGDQGRYLLMETVLYEYADHVLFHVRRAGEDRLLRHPGTRTSTWTTSPPTGMRTCGGRWRSY